MLAYLDQQTEESHAGDRLVEALAAACERLADFPQIGRKRDDLRKGLRGFPVGEYLILYRTSQGPFRVEIARILHHRQDLRKAFPLRTPRERR